MTGASIEELDRLSADAFVAAVAPLFEGAPRFLVRLAAERPFGSAGALFSSARGIARGMPEEDQLELIDAHPRLGAAPESVSPISYIEQGYERSVTDLAEELRRLNAAYEARFGFRYCVFVAGRSRSALLPGMESALDADRDVEIARALDAVIDIAHDRWHKLAAEA
ncbi:MAG: 2-oxo-4-hydroxy-4-carboxy-5-ureidoimidazoline decarboxylase [Candidatus Limnocylindrales bacterium]